MSKAIIYALNREYIPMRRELVTEIDCYVQQLQLDISANSSIMSFDSYCKLLKLEAIF